jgi:hypothetical protein
MIKQQEAKKPGLKITQDTNYKAVEKKFNALKK